MEDTLNKLIHNNTVDYPIYIDFHLPTYDTSNNKYPEIQIDKMCNEFIDEHANENIPKIITLSHNGTLFYITWLQNVIDDNCFCDIVKTIFEDEILFHVTLYGKLHKINTAYTPEMFNN